jgi:hypothetical protein
LLEGELHSVALDHSGTLPVDVPARQENTKQWVPLMAGMNLFATMAALALLGAASGASAQDSGRVSQEPVGKILIKPIAEARIRYETVDQGSLDAEAVTLRLRAGAQATVGRLSLLAEAEGTVAPIDKYNAFPFPLAGSSQRRPGHSVVADPGNIELNRLQLQYKMPGGALTLGRQRINLDDQRWVGSVGWRQNEQTFDAARGEGRLGPIAADLTYAISQRTIFGEYAGPRTSLGGDFIFAGISSKPGPVEGKLFAYLLDYDAQFFLANSSQTYGGILRGTFPLGANRNLTLRASYARQSDYAGNPFNYAADYWSFEGGTGVAGFNLAAGWEKLGSDNKRSVQTPMATLHKFNGWADMFLTTPPAGLQDGWVSVTRKFDGVKLLPGLNAGIAFHRFNSDRGNIEYGTEWNASAGARFGKVPLLLKYATYKARGFGVDTRKLWLQADWAF